MDKNMADRDLSEEHRDRFYSALDSQESEETALISNTAEQPSTSSTTPYPYLPALHDAAPTTPTVENDEHEEQLAHFWMDVRDKATLKEGFYSDKDTPRHFLQHDDVAEHYRRDEYPHSRLMDLGGKHRHHGHHHHHKKKHSKPKATGTNTALPEESSNDSVFSPGSPAKGSTKVFSSDMHNTGPPVTNQDKQEIHESTVSIERCDANDIAPNLHNTGLRRVTFSTPEVSTSSMYMDSESGASPESDYQHSPVSNKSLPGEALTFTPRSGQEHSQYDDMVDIAVEVDDQVPSTSYEYSPQQSNQLTTDPEVTVISPSPKLKRIMTSEEDTPVTSPSVSADTPPPLSSPARARGSDANVDFFIGESPERSVPTADPSSKTTSRVIGITEEEEEEYDTPLSELPIHSGDPAPSLSQTSSHIHLYPKVTFSLGSDASGLQAMEKSDTTPAEFKPWYIDSIPSTRKTPHEHIPRGRDLEKRRTRGSEVRLHDQGRSLHDAGFGISEAALDELASHRFDDAKAMQQRKIAHENGQMNGGYSDGYEPATKLERLPRAPDHTPHELFVEMDELYLNQEGLYEWKQKSRWIKYEEDVLEGAERWGKPHVASLSFHSMLELRKCIEKGAVILDLEDGDLQGIANGVVDELIATEQLDPRHRADIISSFLLKHTFMEDNKGFLRKNSHAYIGLVDLEEGKTPEAKGMFGGKKYRFSEPYISLKDAKPNGKSSTNDLMPPKVNPLHTNGVGIVNKALQVDEEIGHPGSLKKSQNLAGSTSSIKVDLDLMKKIPKGAQTTSVLVGTLDYLEKPVMAFVRLSRGRYLGNFTQVPLPVRFIFMLMGPSRDYEYTDVGRSISTLMSNKKFHEIAYAATSRDDLLRGLNEFLDDSLVLPPGELDKKTLLPVLNMAKEKAKKKKQKKLEKEKALGAQKTDGAGGGGDDEEDDPLARTGRPLGGVIKDMRKRFPLYLSDIKDGLNLQCLSAFFFIYFAAFAPAITFGGLLSDKTESWIGVTEMLIGVSSMGLIFHLFAAQPLLICGFTGPLLVFEEGLYQLTGQVGLEYISFRVWVGFWLTAITTLVLVFEGSFLVRLISRFTEEIFSALISLIFIIETFVKLAGIFDKHPLMDVDDYGDQVAEVMTSPMSVLNMTTADMLGMVTNSMAMGDNGTVDINGTMDNATDMTTMLPISTTEGLPTNQPNTALLSLILTLSTFAIAYFLKHFRNSKYLGRTARRCLGDFGVPIAIVIMVVVDILIKETYTDKLFVPDGLEPTDAEKRGWFINPLGMEDTLPIWAYFAAVVPAFLLFILIFMETMITNIIVCKKLTPDNKGAGYHWSMFLIGCMGSVTGLLGLPFLTAATVRSVTHVNALQVFGNSHAPGDKPVLEEVKEQRVTGILVHIFIGVSVLLGPVLRQIPLPVLFGVFLYMGVASMNGVQLFDRVYLMFKPVKYHPDVGYVKNVRTWKMHLFTFIQLIALGVLWAVKSTEAALAFPFVLILLVPVRKYILTKMFTDTELDELDKDDKKASKEPIVYDSDEDDDFYTEAHMPI